VYVYSIEDPGHLASIVILATERTIRGSNPARRVVFLFSTPLVLALGPNNLLFFPRGKAARA
jgi:hypothetical protein